MKLKNKHKNQLFALIPFLAIAFLFAFFIVGGSEQVAPTSYKVIDLKKSLIPKEENRIDFIFWSDCGACFSLTKELNNWLSNKRHITLNKVPATGSGWETDAKLYITLTKLAGVRSNAVYDNYIDAIHIQKTVRNFSSKQNFITSSLNISEDDFIRVYNSQSVANELTKAREINQRLGVRSVPQLIVNGKYYINMQAFNSYDDLFNEITRLMREKP